MYRQLNRNRYSYLFSTLPLAFRLPTRTEPPSGGMATSSGSGSGPGSASTETAYNKARLAVLKHAATQTLVVNGEYGIECWAQEFAEHRAKYKKISSILHSDDLPNGNKGIDIRVLTVLSEADAFIRARALSSWQGKWVDPHWRRAALEREQNERERRAEVVLESLEVEFDYTEGSDDGGATGVIAKVEETEDALGASPSPPPSARASRSKSGKAKMKSGPASKRATFTVLDAVEIKKPSTAKGFKPSGSDGPSTPVRSGSAITKSRFPSEQDKKTGPLRPPPPTSSSSSAPPARKRTRSQASLKNHSVSNLGLSSNPPQKYTSPPLTFKNKPKCDRCEKRKRECFTALNKLRCEACCRGKLACSLVSAAKRNERNLKRCASGNDKDEKNSHSHDEDGLEKSTSASGDEGLLSEEL
ncbi:hypothetical protein D9757_009006 [Collybiopsis confluens]|uniref:Uncharacterized protein n=1 Tax=Collybiopsis confluens TaxID=2823264 RepID=A0A8H5H2Y7_9AGAR|nr:hypothetical protein D9757_009006 [Collybiopsis confluens]